MATELIRRVGCLRCQDEGCHKCRPGMSRRSFFRFGALFAGVAAMPGTVLEQTKRIRFMEGSMPNYYGFWANVGPARKEYKTVELYGPSYPLSIYEVFVDGKSVMEAYKGPGQRVIHLPKGCLGESIEVRRRILSVSIKCPPPEIMAPDLNLTMEDLRESTGRPL